MPNADHATQWSDFVSLRDLVHPIVRYRWAALLTFGCLFGAAIAAAAIMKPEYEATAKVLVKRERMDPVMTAAAAAPSQDRADVTEDELNSEVELLKSRDLLQQVVRDSGLAAAARPGTAVAGTDRSEPETSAAISRAVLELEGNLQIGAIRKSTVIELRYRSADPEQAATVLSTLARLYVEKHLAVHRPVGAYEFFSEQTRTFAVDREAAEARLAEFGRQEEIVSPLAERDSALRTLAELEASLLRTQAEIAEAERRLETLDGQIASTPIRQTTQIRTAKDDERIRDLKATLFNLELRRADLLRKFTADYPPLEEVTQEIAQTQAALSDAERTDVTAETTDQNPTHQWLRDERARAATGREALEAREQALARAVDEYRARAQHLDEARVRHDALQRALKTAQDNYDLYQRKQEEARISDALDRTRVANVVLTEAPMVPTVPSNSRRLALLMLGFVVALVGGTLVALLLHHLNPYFRSDDEVVSYLGVPVLATLPAETRIAS
jgi:uncharacterized protein involved in exopolysaccharide biosynthesis